jgi:HK97 family phage portal protein
MNRFTLYDGASLKSKDLSAWTADEWSTVFGSYFGSQDESPRSLYSAVGWLYACVNLRSDRIASMPWALFQGEKQIVSDEDDLTRFGYLDNFTDMLELTEASLCICGYAYWFKQRNLRNVPLAIRWFAPDTVEPVYNSLVGIAGFKRRVGGTSIAYPAASNATVTYSPEDIVYFKLPNVFSELEPGVPPARAAMSDSQVLNNMNEFKGQFFARGAIKATVLSIDPDTQDSEMAKIEAWWKRFFSGVRKAWSTAAIRGKLEAVVVGEGLESLTNSELTIESRQAIATALGVPHSIVAADAANFATAQQDELNFLNNCIIPESKLIERTLNRQMFAPVGLRFQFQPDRLSAMQEDEEQRAQSYATYVNAKIKPSIAAQLVGLALPDGITYEMLDEEMQIERERADAQAQAQIARLEQPRQLTGPVDDRAQRDEEVRRLKRWAKGKKAPDVDHFHSHLLDRAEKLAAIGAASEYEVAGGEDATFPYP